jgi:hypothetical protein
VEEGAGLIGREFALRYVCMFTCSSKIEMCKNGNLCQTIEIPTFYDKKYTQ